ncbi:MAG: hypothetical protein KAU21_01275 [Gammaproteobacteria bacterium]|nr:hypothetical protein [Gammaproteobacteria bacterium]
MISKKLIYLPSILLILCQNAWAGEYVPPPTGPYKSSGIIYKKQSQSNDSDQVYKFPSDSLIQSERRDEPVFISDSRIRNESVDISSKPVLPPQQVVDPAVNLAEPSVFINPSSSMPGQIAVNPWAAESVPRPDVYQQNYYQGRWSAPQYGYPQQNPYINNSQTNFMNDPFNSMSSPWSAMPMQPFFSGR